MQISETVKCYIFVCIILAFHSKTVNGQGLCPYAWTKDVLRGRCIKAMNRQKGYEAAKASCQTCGGGLVRIENETDHEMVNSIIRDTGHDYFIDMNDNETALTWKFENGDLVQWFNWDSGQPNNDPSPQHCVVITSALDWHDRRCFDEYYYICELNSGIEWTTKETYKMINASCLETHSPMKTFPSPRSDDCAATCGFEPCCNAFASGNDECILYEKDLSNASPECPGAGYQLFTMKLK